MSLLVMVLVYEYLKTVFRVEIRPQGLTVFYPLRSIPWAAITGIDMADTFYKGPGIRKSGCLPKAT
ncbi:MAG: PH domain-containing protein [Desulfobacterales bacterium]